jgi:hypothetical protein
MRGGTIIIGARLVEPTVRPPRRRRVPVAPLAQETLIEVDRKLARLARMEGAHRLRIGEALEAMHTRSLHHELGFSSLQAYVMERCSQPGRWGEESRRLSRKLSGLPVLRAALVSGTLGWSMVELLARYATPEAESGMVAEACGTTFRRMRASLRAAQPDKSVAEGEERATITISMSDSDAWLFEHTRVLFNRVQPGVNADQVVHWLAVEAMTSLVELVPSGEMVEYRARADELREKSAAWRAERRAWCEEAETRVEGGLDLAVPDALDIEREWELAIEDGPNARALDAHIRDVCQELAARDLLFGALAERFWRSDGWRRLGYASERQYVSERLGVSISSIKGKRALARHSMRMPSVAAAIERREIGFEAALLVLRVATEHTVDAWLARAAERTVKHLRQEVDAAEHRIRMGELRDQLPPDEDVLREIAARREEAGKRLSGAEPDESFAVRTRSVLSQLSAEPVGRTCSGRRIRYRFHVTRDTYDLWSAFEECVQAARGWLPVGVTPIRLLCTAFCVEWCHVLAKELAYGDVYARDNFECQSPLCTRRDVTPHHLVFRSKGGGDDLENLISLCTWCHLFGIHQGLIRAEPPASKVRWELGREPIIVVEGRRLGLGGRQR